MPSRIFAQRRWTFRNGAARCELVAHLHGGPGHVQAKAVEGFDPRLRLIAACLVDDDGAPIFSEEDLGELGAKNAEVIARLWKKCVEINGMTLKSDGSDKSTRCDGGAEESTNG